METRAHYVAVGAFVVVMIVIAFAAVLWLTRGALTTQYAHYYVYFEGPVTGLRSGAPVEYSGVPIGKVSDVRIDPDNVELIRVTLAIDEGVVIKADARASVETNFLSGVSFIQIVGGTRDAKVLVAKKGQRYPVIHAHRSRLARAVHKAPQLVEKLNEAANRVNALLNEKNRQAFAASLDNLRSFTAALASRNKELEEFTSNANASAATLAQLLAHINETYAGPNGLGNRLNKTIADFDVTAKSLTETNRQLQIALREVKPGLRTFSRQTLTEVGALVAQARTLIAGLTRLTAEIERNPSQVLFGDRREGYRPR